MTKIISLTHLSGMASIITDFKSALPRFTVYKSRLVKNRHIYKSARFTHSKRLE